MAARLHYELGLSMGKTAAVLHEVLGIRITRGGVAQALARLGEQLRTHLRGAGVQRPRQPTGGDGRDRLAGGWDQGLAVGGGG